jgi:hypothetical protein
MGRLTRRIVNYHSALLCISQGRPEVLRSCDGRKNKNKTKNIQGKCELVAERFWNHKCYLQKVTFSNPM